MIGVVMAGGRGSRMNIDAEKLLLGRKKPVIMHVIDSMRESRCFSNLYGIVSPNTPATSEYLRQKGIPIMETQGRGYARDLSDVLCRLDGPVMVLSGDMPHMDASIIRKVSLLYNPDHAWKSVVVSKELADANDIDVKYLVRVRDVQCCYTGVSVINASAISDAAPVPETYAILDDVRIAFNINTMRDYESLGTA